MARMADAMEPTVFLGSALVIVAFVLFGTLYDETAVNVFTAVQAFIVGRLGWFYVLSVTALLVVVLWLMVGPFGGIRLGGPDARPEFGYAGWFAMLFSAGMGTGLVFWSVAEPVTHFLEAPAVPGGNGAVTNAMRVSFFHWGLHPWAVYAVFGLAIAYYHFRYALPLAPRSLLYPILGERIRGPIGHAVDILATVGTLFGVATSLGFGAMQINAGLSQLTAIGQGTDVQVAIIGLITLVATASVVIGLHGGIQRLSKLNMALAAAMLLFVFFAGPTVQVLDLFTTSVGSYLQNIVASSLWMDVDNDSSWQADWTLFYWSWWISWSPFVGVFVARISYGRTVREFVVSVLLVPTAATFVWLSVFGGTALDMAAGDTAFAARIQGEPALALHAMLERLPGSPVTGVLATLLVVIFFITSSDSGSLVDDMVTSGGHPNPPRAQRVFWAFAEGAVAGTLLLAGGLQALRTASLTSGLAMAVLLLVASYGLLRALRIDQDTRGVPAMERLPR
mgnify:CR=1 FL=1